MLGEQLIQSYARHEKVFSRKTYVQMRPQSISDKNQLREHIGSARKSMMKIFAA